MKKLSLLFIFIPILAFTQVPGFEIYTMYIGGNTDSGFYYTEPLNISNHAGYDNQPSFSWDNTHLLFTSIRENDQADIYKYTFATSVITKVTSTPESEYSPEYSPDGKYITTVRVAMDTTQRLWKYKVKRKKFKPVLKNVYNVGYYCRVNLDVVALFLLPEPFALQLSRISEPISQVIDKNIGRSMKMIPGEFALSYISKNDSTFNLIKRFDLEYNKITAIKKVPPECEDMVWSYDGKLFMAKGNKIYFLDYVNTMDWYLFADLSEFGIKTIFRIAISPDQTMMAFVAEE
ncbi:MAG: PD40 domain-containing protein [Chitinophagales bacterium]|nr:PD40 domain-containing protein [Chitinophagales bacterium]